MIGFNHVLRIGKHEVTVRLQVYQSVRNQETAVTVHEISGSQPLGSLLHLRVRESQPDFAYLSRGKETVDDFNVRPQKGCVCQSFF